jgi:hypothetical protein
MSPASATAAVPCKKNPLRNHFKGLLYWRPSPFLAKGQHMGMNKFVDNWHQLDLPLFTAAV